MHQFPGRSYHGLPSAYSFNRHAFVSIGLRFVSPAVTNNNYYYCNLFGTQIITPNKNTEIIDGPLVRNNSGIILLYLRACNTMHLNVRPSRLLKISKLIEGGGGNTRICLLVLYTIRYYYSK